MLQLSASDGLLSAADTIAVTVNANPANKAIDFGGTNAYVTFGAAAGLGVQNMTLETWFRRDGAGVATNTGTGGVIAVPLVTKGMAQTEGGTVDMNYFLGIRGTDGVLVGRLRGHGDWREPSHRRHDGHRRRRRVASRGGDLRRHDVAALPRTARSTRSSWSARSRRGSTALSTRRSAPR